MNSRKMRILEAIVNDYIALAEPIGSRTIAKKYDFGLSSATIRNEMSDLEGMGYITAPHASSGRIPSDAGYRLYVDRVMKRRRLSREEKSLLVRALQREEGQARSLIKEMARAVALITNYTIVATEPVNDAHKIKLIQVVVVDGPVVALVLITDLNVAKNQVVVLPKAPGHSVAARLSTALTAMLSGSAAHDLGGLYNDMARHHFREMGLDEAYVDPLLAAIQAALRTADSSEIYTIGMKNILDFPEFADLQKARAIVGRLEEKEGLLGLMAQCCDEIGIIIGAENEDSTLKECSIIRAKISINGQPCGNIAIIGPTRMDYAQVVAVLQATL
ncbi:MAG: heat-inducible transcriptional repressor HrcA [Clostridiales bacterium]|jgi:heat-inducible transcriptional repressor|nr:heat-inducible transcriptional repressor HrcA [Clostridiales bacterium]